MARRPQQKALRSRAIPVSPYKEAHFVPVRRWWSAEKWAAETRLRRLAAMRWRSALALLSLGGCVLALEGPPQTTVVGSRSSGGSRSGVCAPQDRLSRRRVACMLVDEGALALPHRSRFNQALGVRNAGDIIKHFGCLAEHESARGSLRCGIGGEGLLGVNRMHMSRDACPDSLDTLRNDHRANIRCAFDLYLHHGSFWDWGRPQGTARRSTRWGTNKHCPSRERSRFPTCLDERRARR